MEKITKREALCSVLRTKYYSRRQIKKNEISGQIALLGKTGGGCIQDFGGKTWGKETT